MIKDTGQTVSGLMTGDRNIYNALEYMYRPNLNLTRGDEYRLVMTFSDSRFYSLALRYPNGTLYGPAPNYGFDDSGSLTEDSIVYQYFDLSANATFDAPPAALPPAALPPAALPTATQPPAARRPPAPRPALA